MVNTDREDELHSVPCKIHYDGSAPIDQFFHSLREKVDQQTENPSAKETSSLRGRPLVGDSLNLPANYAFFKVSVESDAEELDEELKNKENLHKPLTLEHKFDRTIFWNYDLEPNKNDSIQKALDWLNIAKCLASNENFDQ